MRSVGILTVYMVIYGNYHCKDILHGTVPLIAVRNPEVAVGGIADCPKTLENMEARFRIWYN